MKTALLLMLLLATAFAHGNETFAEAQALIDASTPCSALTTEQLAAIGDYYMEQMHPGEAHELMDEMMGGEGSASLEQVHVAMAQRLYCGESVNYGGMMGGYGMMSFGYAPQPVTQYLYPALMVGLVVLVYLAIIKLLKGGKK